MITTFDYFDYAKMMLESMQDYEKGSAIYG